jgi:diadenosine hexaphosphate hydrolase (ATP-forming)
VKRRVRVFVKKVEQAGAVVFKNLVDPKILIVRAKQDPSQWIFPKGHVEPGESLPETAVREAREEAGVIGEIVSALSPPVKFKKDNAEICVRYFLAELKSEVPAQENREKVWASPDEARRLLTHDDSREVLESALQDIATVARTPSAVDSDEFREFLMKEYEHLVESLLRNEEDGERRVSFLITLDGAVAAGLGFLLEKESLSPERIDPILTVVLIALLLIGHISFLRVINRNVVTDEYKSGLNRIRRYFVRSPYDRALRYFEFDPFKIKPRETRLWSMGKGGWLETVVLVQSLLCGVLAANVIPTRSWWYDALIAVVFFAGTWLLLMQYASERYQAEKRKKLR